MWILEYMHVYTCFLACILCKYFLHVVLLSNMQFSFRVSRRDIIALNHLQQYTNIIPVVAESHALTAEESNKLKSLIQLQLAAFPIQYWTPEMDPQLDHESTEDLSNLQVIFYIN